jgi:hypothetical protein
VSSVGVLVTLPLARGVDDGGQDGGPRQHPP